MSTLDDMLRWHAVHQFYIREARLLDDLAFTDWVDLFTDDCTYWMPIVSNRIGKDIGREKTRPGELAHFEDDKTSLRNRARRLERGPAWAETPPGRTRHFVSNLEVTAGEHADELATRTSFLIWRSHMETDQEIFSGFRRDILRRVNGSFAVARRGIILDHAVLTQKSLGIFF